MTTGDSGAHEVVVLGAGPAGLAAGLELARAGVGVVVVEAAPRVGGLCLTLRRDGFAYDIGGHIPFVRDDARRTWLAGLLGRDLLWVDRPVTCLREGRITRGRYLDQRPAEPAPPAPERRPASAAEALADRFGADFADRVMRPYLEKVDGVDLGRVVAGRATKLLESQSAPTGFWFPAEGIGQLMDAMAARIVEFGGEVLTDTPARAIDAAGGRLRAIEVVAPDGPRIIAPDRAIVAIPPPIAAAMLRPAPDPPLPIGRMRATCLVYLAIDRPRLTAETWIQVDDPAVPFARVVEPGNWSDRLTPAGQTVVGMECYCAASPADPVWARTDAELAGVCCAGLRRLGWLAPDVPTQLLQVIRLRHAYPVPFIDQIAALEAPGRALDAIRGLRRVPGGALIEAIEAGERAAAVLLATDAAATLAS